LAYAGDPQSIPEPGSLFILAVGLLVLLALWVIGKLKVIQ
jgi:PEP-CTERM motif